MQRLGATPHRFSRCSFLTATVETRENWSSTSWKHFKATGLAFPWCRWSIKSQEHPRDGFEALYYLPLLPSVEHTRGMHFATATIGPARHLAAILLSKIFVGGGASCRLFPSISLLSSTHVWVCKCVCDACNINMRVCVCVHSTHAYTCYFYKHWETIT